MAGENKGKKEKNERKERKEWQGKIKEQFVKWYSWKMLVIWRRKRARDWKWRREEAPERSSRYRNERGTEALMTAGNGLRKAMDALWAPSYTELQWTVRADEQGGVGVNTVYNLLVIWEGGWDELLIIFRLSGLRKGTHLGLMSKQRMEKWRTPPSPASMGDLSSVLHWLHSGMSVFVFLPVEACVLASG